jgi:hypothetical protein
MELVGTSQGEEAARLARAAVDWLVEGTALGTQDPSLYHGLAGVVLALEEVNRHFGDERYGDAAARGADVLVDMVDRVEDCSLAGGCRRRGRPQRGRS